MNLKHGDRVFILGWYDHDGSPQHCKVTGAVQTWKTRPGHFRVPVKRGMREYGEITHETMGDFSLTAPDGIKKEQVYRGKKR